MPIRSALAVCAVLLAAAALAVAWRVTGMASADAVVGWMARARGDTWAPAVGIGAALVAGHLAFPIIVVMCANGMAFGPWLGLFYSAIGMILSALTMYTLGACLGRQSVGRLIAARWPRALDIIARRGIPAVVVLRVIPLAPFTVINLALGAMGFAAVDFAVGSAIGMTPSMLVASIVGDRLWAVLAQPTLQEIGLLALSVAAYLAVIYVAQSVARR